MPNIDLQKFMRFNMRLVYNLRKKGGMNLPEFDDWLDEQDVYEDESQPEAASPEVQRKWKEMNQKAEDELSKTSGRLYLIEVGREGKSGFTTRESFPDTPVRCPMAEFHHWMKNNQKQWYECTYCGGKTTNLAFVRETSAPGNPSRPFLSGDKPM